MLDAVFLAATVAIFALIALVAKGVEKLGPPVGPLPPRGTTAPRPPATRGTTAPRHAAATAAPAAAPENGDRS